MKDLFNVQQLSQFEFGAIIITVLVAGLVFGCLLGYALLKRKNTPNAQAAEELKEEFEQYKDKVDDHFNKTSEMFMDVTTQYKKLYDHMAVGAIELSKADTITMPRLEMQDSQQLDVETQAEPDVTHDDDVIDKTSVNASADDPLEIKNDAADEIQDDVSAEEQPNSVETEVIADKDSDLNKKTDDNTEQKTT